MTTVTTSPSVFADISDEHEWLERMYVKIRGVLSRGPGHLAQLRSLFEVLAEEVGRHFENEERGGYFDEVVLMAPRLWARAEELRREHESLLERLQQVCRLLDEARDTPDWWRAISGDFENFLRRCEEHESRENDLVQEAWLQDIGAAD